MIKSEIIADSLNPVGDRLTTFILEYPRYIHSEIMTHRVFSKNAASSRAIPIEKMIQQVKDNPAMPTHWGKNQSGMQANEELDNTKKTSRFITLHRYPDLASDLVDEFPTEGLYFYVYQITEMEHVKRVWLEARDTAIDSVRTLNTIGLHKQIANRLLEPWFHIRIIMSGTEFENFFALRAHKDAHPDFQKLAYMMLEQYNASNPQKLSAGQWHIPFGDKMDEKKIERLVDEIYAVEDKGSHFYHREEQSKRKIAVARCARISYLNYEGKDDYEADIKLCERLFGNIPKHLSPTEHVARALTSSERSGNYVGFEQYRKLFKEENLSDGRVIKKT